MPHKPVAVVVAMQSEVATLLHGRRGSMLDGVKVFVLESAVIAVGGIGRQAAHRSAEAVTRRYTPVVLVSAGIAGALTPAGKVGDVVRARDVVDAATGERFGAGGDDGSVVTASTVSGPAEKETLAQRWKADVVDMEASAVGHVAKAHGIEFVAIKAVSDEFSFAMPPLGQFVNDAGKFETLRFAAFLALHPKWWNAVRELNVNSRAAAVKLSEALQHLIEQRSHATSEGNIVKA